MLQKSKHFYLVKIIKRLSELNATRLAVFWTIAITVASLVSVDNFPKASVPGNDKIVHFIFYFIVTLLWHLAIQPNHNTLITKLIVFVIVVIYGIIIEILQGALTTYRQADFYDVLANAAGASIATFVMIWLNYKTLQKKF